MADPNLEERIIRLEKNFEDYRKHQEELRRNQSHFWMERVAYWAIIVGLIVYLFFG
jgi:hypothetical protein